MTTHLTDTQKQTIRIALATYEGWTELQEIEDCLAGLPPNAKWLEDIPNYPASLDACHAIEVKLTDIQHGIFRVELRALSGFSVNRAETEENWRDYVSASAEHRALALYRSLNLGELGD